jgi:hypothetical protein
LLLPVIAKSGVAQSKPWILTAVSLLVAILTSLGAFYRWDASWQSRMKTALELQVLLAKWELDMASAKIAENPTKEAFAATRQLFDAAFKLIGAETDFFFANVKAPTAEPDK